MLIRHVVLASRPQTLIAAIAPVTLTAAYLSTKEPISLTLTALILLTAILIQIATNFANDLFDYYRGADKDRVGPRRAVQSGLITPQEMTFLLIITLFLALLLGIYLTYIGGWFIFLIGVTALFFSVAYTAGPYPLAYNGLGEIFVLLYFGVLATGGTAWLLVSNIDLKTFLIGIFCGLFATTLLVINNLRDYEGDLLVGKRTTTVRFSKLFGVVEYRLMLFTASLLPFIVTSTLTSLLLLVPLPLFFKLSVNGSREEIGKFLPLTATYYFFAVVLLLIIFLGE
jgi:1,4-dihydroxy-2-naphthoate octaprenyltransferase